MKVGIDAIAFDIPKLFLPISDLAVARNIEPEKLTKGLGLQKMTLLDTYQDVVTMAGNAVLKLMKNEGIAPESISKLYVGTESGVDGSKPIASYLISMLESVYGEGSFMHIDAVDLTFACIGGIDALQNTVDYIKLNPEETAIVVTTDWAKYDLESSGEYTQGAGAIAMSVKSNPSIISFDGKTGVSTQGVFDFFKPRRYIDKTDITSSHDNEPWMEVLEQEIAIYKEQPVFDGQYSNQCYIDRITDAYYNYKTKNKVTNNCYEDWAFICFHLPYCFQARRTFIEIFAKENPSLLENQLGDTTKDKLKALTKSPEYMAVVNEKIYPSEIGSAQVGNIYTGSIFLGFISTLCHAYNQEMEIVGKSCGFIAYGSGSKSKVFTGKFEANWKPKIAGLKLFETLDQLNAVSIDTYQKLHKKEIKEAILTPNNEFVLSNIEKSDPVRIGARHYSFID
jgi:hydroxymethylglutaryl-CoA synthase